MFVFSKDYKGPGFGFLTKAREYDKWAHAGGSAFCYAVFLAACRLFGITLSWGLHDGRMAIGLGAFVVLWGGVALEVIQGFQAGDKIEDPSIRVYTDSDGFSFLDVAADLLGIAVVAALAI